MLTTGARFLVALLGLALSGVGAGCGSGSAGTPDAGDGVADGGAAAPDAAAGACSAISRSAPTEWMAWSATPVSPPDGAYQVTADTVVDTQTCLEWQRAASPTRLPWQAAVDGCAALDLGGATDWRLPTAIELKSILDRTRVGPAINPTAFPDTPFVDEDWYWSATPVIRDQAYSWAIGFLQGVSTPAGLGLSLNVRCVRGASGNGATGAAAARYTLATATARDEVTGLTWAREASATMLTWSAATDYCAALTLDQATWRLPTIVELESLVDVSRYNWALDPTAFPRPASPEDDRFWAATDDARDPSNAWAIDFYHGNSNTWSDALTSYARCVH